MSARSPLALLALLALAQACGLTAGCRGDDPDPGRSRTQQPEPAPERGPEQGAEPEYVVPMEQAFALDLARPRIRIPLDAEPGPVAAEPRRQAFLAFEVTAVTNPRRRPLVFAVAFERHDGAAVALGTFGLFPADNPGRFLVATQNRLAPGGAVVVTLLTPDATGAEAGDDARIRVEFGPLGFRE